MANPGLTDRQLREIEYFREFVKRYDGCSACLPEGFFDISEKRDRRWWDPIWTMYSVLRQKNVRNKRVLVAGCGGGADAFRLRKMGADVYAFDLSPDMIALARRVAAGEGLDISFGIMALEDMEYKDDFFDGVVVAAVLHHCDIPGAIEEIHRVAKDGAMLVIGEPYSHSAVVGIRHSTLVESVIYPRLASLVLRGKERILTQDERKITERDVRSILGNLRYANTYYFKLLYNRLFPENLTLLRKMDQMCLRAWKPVGPLLAGKVLIEGEVSK